MPKPNSPPPAWPRLVLKRADQAVAAVVIGLSLAAMGGYWLWQGHLQGRMVEIDRAEPLVVEFRLDINRADWPELCLMPGIGEQLAQRIVDYRAENGPFRELNDLRKVRGIGPLTLEGMKPYLLPMPGLEETAEDKSGLPAGQTLN
jgi:competence protein ComEA